jgi:hypothetical protein
MSKSDLLIYFRSRASESLAELRVIYGSRDYKKLAAAVNQAITQTRNQLLKVIEQRAEREQWAGQEKLSAILLATYASYVVMLDSRNEVWPYDYMSFSRRIGELWEPFCKLCFEFSLTPLQLFTPPLFSEVKQQLAAEISVYVDGLALTPAEKNELQRYYQKVWTLVDAGQVKLELDLHFAIGNEQYNVDFKSGFGSNEKGNTNRLLLVASIYQNLSAQYRCLLLVRSEEEANNHYFQTLKHSGVWDAYCGAEAYSQITNYTGFDIKAWIGGNVAWLDDLSAQTRAHLVTNNLEAYLKW